MPKFFTITMRVEELALGRVMRLMHKTEGVIDFDFDMGDAKPNGQRDPNKEYRPRKSVKYGTKGDALIMQLLHKAGKPLHGSDLEQAFEKAGRSSRSTSSPLHLLRQQGLIETTPEGYVLTKKAKNRLRHRKEA